VTNGYWAVVQDFTHQSAIKEIKLLTKVVTDLGRSKLKYYKYFDEAECTYTLCLKKLDMYDFLALLNDNKPVVRNFCLLAMH